MSPTPTALWAPVHRALQRMALGASGIPPLAAPSIDYLGSGIQDHRLPYNLGQFGSVGVLGFLSSQSLCLSAVPSTLGTAKLAALANVATGVAMTLAVASAGITVVPANTRLLPANNVISAGRVIDGLTGLKAFGSKGFTAFYDRATMLARALTVTGVVGGTGGNFLVSGYDVYGYPMSELIAATAGATTATGKKAFKIVTSIVPQFTDAHNYSFGTSDVYGLPIRTPLFSEALIHWNDALITANTGFVVPDTTAPATTATGDVRGTYATQSASDGTKRLVFRLNPSLAAVQTDPTVGLFGVAQV